MLNKTKFLFALLIIFAVVSGAFLSSCAQNVPVSSGNATCYGYTLVDGDDIYYTKIICDEDNNLYSNIYKYNVKTQKEILVSSVEAFYDELNGFLSLDGGYLYFLPNFLHDSMNEASHNIYKVKPDGKNVKPTPLFEKNIECTFMHVADGMIYYFDEADYSFYKIKTDGTKREFICEAPNLPYNTLGIAVGKDKIYYAEDELLMAVSLNGGKPEVIFDFYDYDVYIDDLILDGDYLYYLCDQSQIGKIKTDGTENRTIYTYTSGWIDFFNFSDGILYLVVDSAESDSSWEILSVVPGSKSAKVLVSAKENLLDIWPPSIWGDKIYFVGVPQQGDVLGSDEGWYTVGKNGGDITAFQPLNAEIEGFGADIFGTGKEE